MALLVKKMLNNKKSKKIPLTIGPTTNPEKTPVDAQFVKLIHCLARHSGNIDRAQKGFIRINRIVLSRIELICL